MPHALFELRAYWSLPPRRKRAAMSRCGCLSPSLIFDGGARRWFLKASAQFHRSVDDSLAYMTIRDYCGEGSKALPEILSAHLAPIRAERRSFECALYAKSYFISRWRERAISISCRALIARKRFQAALVISVSYAQVSLEAARCRFYLLRRFRWHY